MRRPRRIRRRTRRRARRISKHTALQGKGNAQRAEEGFFVEVDDNAGERLECVGESEARVHCFPVEAAEGDVLCLSRSGDTTAVLYRFLG